jgi:hypothetical protein
MSRLRFILVALMAVLSPIGGGVARADAPAPGDPCTGLHSTTHDANGRMMWCNPTMTGANALVWQYGGPSTP